MSPSKTAKLDRAAFERAVRDHHAAVFRAAHRIVQDDALALDAAQQTFLRVLEGKLDLAQANDAQRLLRCAAAREALMVLRAARNRRRREETHAMERRESFEERGAEQAKLWAGVRRALAELPEDLRNAIALRFGEGLTFAEVGDVLAISEPSAHQRVQRGLSKLRERLERMGFAATLPALTEILERDDAPALPPSGAEAQLLTLSAAGKSSIGVFAGLALVSIAALGAVGVRAWRRSSTERVRTDTSLANVESEAFPTAPRVPDPAETSRTPTSESGDVRAEVVSNTTPGTSPESDDADLPRGVLEGVVVDEFGLPLEGVQVRASSVERQSKLALFSDTTLTARDGTFRLSLPVALASGQDYAVAARTPTFAKSVGVVRVPADGTAPRQRIEMQREVVDAPGDWKLWLTVRDASGAPVAGAVARLQWTVRNSEREEYTQEQARGVTAIDGRVAIEGEGLGRRLLTIDARSAGLAPHRESIVFEYAGDVQREFTLTPGLELRGVIVDVSGAPITAARLGSSTVSLYATEFDRNVWYEAEIVEPGRFRVPALAARPHTLRFRHDRWSGFTLPDVTPGAGELHVVLKTKTDTSDVGTHDAEIHGALVDAATGAPVSARGLATWLATIRDDSPALDDRDWSPLVVEGVIAQTFDGFQTDEEQPPRPPSNVFVYDTLAPGRYAVRIHASGYAPTLLGPIELSEREIAAGFEVRLARGAELVGVVRAANGSPLENAYVLPLGDGGLSREHVAKLDAEVRSKAGRGFVASSAAKTDAAGSFRFQHAPTDRRLRLVVLHAEHEPAYGGWLDLREGAKASFELRAGAARER